MSLLQVLRDLLPLVLILFVVEGFVWLRRDQFILVSSWPRRFRLRRGPWVGLAVPSPLLRVYRSYRSPILLSTQGLFLRTSNLDRPPTWYDPESFTFFPWADLPRHLRVEGASLLLSGHRTPLPSVGHARSLARTLLELQSLEIPERRDSIRSRVVDAWRPSRVRDSTLAFQQSSRFLTAVCWFYTLAIAAGSVAIAWTEPTPFATRAGLLLLAITYGALLLLLRATRKRLRSQGLVEAKGVVMGAIMSPPGAALSVVQLGRDLLRSCEASATLVALAPSETSRDWLARELAGVDLALASLPSAEALREIWLEAWEIRSLGIATLLEETGLCESEFRAPPKETHSAAPFCPLCREVFQDIAECPDCELVLLVPGVKSGATSEAISAREEQL